MNLRSYGDVANVLRNRIGVMPNNFDLIVGIPRSGLFVALMLGMAWRIPVTDIKGALAGRVIDSGSTTTSGDVEPSVDFGSPHLRILLVDDSCHSGTSMKLALDQLQEYFGGINISTFCCYVSPPSQYKVDYYGEVLNPHHVFEWNISRNIILEEACVDIDGVLCPDPPYSELNDESLYLEYIKTAPMLMKPERQIKYLVTNRLECRRHETEHWLATNNIRYQNLIMHPARTVKERSARDSSWHKSDFYMKSDANIFIESEIAQAHDIWVKTGKPVLSFENFQFPDGHQELYKRGLNSMVLRNIKKLSPFLSSVGRNGGFAGFCRNGIVTLLKRHVR